MYHFDSVDLCVRNHNYKCQFVLKPCVTLFGLSQLFHGPSVTVFGLSHTINGFCLQKNCYGAWQTRHQLQGTRMFWRKGFQYSIVVYLVSQNEEEIKAHLEIFGTSLYTKDFYSWKWSTNICYSESLFSNRYLSNCAKKEPSEPRGGVGMVNIFQENVSLVFHIARRVAMYAW